MSLLLQLTDTASYAINSFQSVSSSWAPSLIGLTINTIVSSGSSYINMTFVNGLLTFIEPINNNVLILSGSSNYLSISNPTGSINEANNNWTIITSYNCVNLISLDCNSNQLISLLLPNATSLTQLICYANQLATLDVSTNTSLTHLNCSNNPLSIVNLSTLSSLTYLDAEDIPLLTTVDISHNPLLTYINLSIDGLNQSSVDGILGSLVNFGLSNGSVNLANGTSSPPSVNGYASCSILLSRGWSVVTN
jgi:hypothetical protein